MATQLCQKCKQAHPGRVCDYDDKAECAETKAVDGIDQAPEYVVAPGFFPSFKSRPARFF